MAKDFVRNLSITQGDDDSAFIIMTFKDGDGPIDASAWEFWYTAKVNEDDADDDAVVKKDPAAWVNSDGNGTKDKWVLPLVAADTSSVAPGIFTHDVQVKKDSKISTIMKGLLTIGPQVTIRTT